MPDGSGTPASNCTATPPSRMPRNCWRKLAFRAAPKDGKEEIKRIYAACNDPKIQFQIITGLQLRAWGKTDSKSKPAEPIRDNHMSSTERLEQLFAAATAARRASKSSDPG